MDRRDRRVLLGRVAGVHGVRGGLKVESFTEPRGQILDYQPWTLRHAGAETVRRARALVREPRLAVQLDGVEDRDAASALIGAEIWVRRDQLPTPPAGEYYWVDLEGLAVVNLEGIDLGVVDHLFATGANDVLVVRGGDCERLIPFVQGSHVREIDLAGGRMTVDWDADF
ncbi:ribosome maturation factor RimM [Pseudofulvimonas gallinarii]|jgi:16S rRNA processing protein RimM|uniref:Ribosome maturation factor RimM n=1 Tax=Pseudofulvimonas gallinarii TaxID=634155 RepID=A0A4R3LJD4_9GAMM|nr:ribosome maturation factor RimM [Pseudofulvimonas gallinarii]TCS97756.1 16S rRNA processing protein RimM [Pseudofulvimonas gallinarii]THD13385.1 ribosome maturation factor RimM [Pseudofulvimonas gallinarii]